MYVGVLWWVRLCVLLQTVVIHMFLQKSPKIFSVAGVITVVTNGIRYLLGRLSSEEHTRIERSVYIVFPACVECLY